MFADHFKKLSNNQDGLIQDQNAGTANDPRSGNHSINEMLNLDFKVDEIKGHVSPKFICGKSVCTN